jgi:hypothetical protein
MLDGDIVHHFFADWNDCQRLVDCSIDKNNQILQNEDLDPERR